MIRFFLFFLALFFSLAAILKLPAADLIIPDNAGPAYRTRHVVIVVVDGPRYSETWGSADHALVPHLKNDLSKVGVINTRFFNDGFTYTNSGHAALTTGVRQQIDNGGNELPANPSIFQWWLEATNAPASKAWIVTSKDKLEVLADTKNPKYHGKFLAKTDCGRSGNGSGYRSDAETFRKAGQILKREHPNLMLVNFKDPDAYGHAANWKKYLKGIKASDEYVWQLWQLIQADPELRNQTTLIMTNDHGRHLDGIGRGYVSHGDDCEGCRHINFFAAGPDFLQNTQISTTYNQTDVPATVAELLGFKMPAGEGRIMWDLFREELRPAPKP